MILDVNIQKTIWENNTKKSLIFTKLVFFHPPVSFGKIFTVLIATEDSGTEHEYTRISKNSSSCKNLEKFLILRDFGFTYNLQNKELFDKIKELGGWGKYLKVKKKYDKLTVSEEKRRDIKVFRKTLRIQKRLYYKYSNLSNFSEVFSLRPRSQKPDQLSFKFND